MLIAHDVKKSVSTDLGDGKPIHRAETPNAIPSLCRTCSQLGSIDVLFRPIANPEGCMPSTSVSPLGNRKTRRVASLSDPSMMFRRVHTRSGVTTGGVVRGVVGTRESVGFFPCRCSYRKCLAKLAGPIVIYRAL